MKQKMSQHMPCNQMVTTLPCHVCVSPKNVDGRMGPGEMKIEAIRIVRIV